MHIPCTSVNSDVLDCVSVGSILLFLSTISTIFSFATSFDISLEGNVKFSVKKQWKSRALEKDKKFGKLQGIEITKHFKIHLLLTSLCYRAFIVPSTHGCP